MFIIKDDCLRTKEDMIIFVLFLPKNIFSWICCAFLNSCCILLMSELKPIFCDLECLSLFLAAIFIRHLCIRVLSPARPLDSLQF